MEVLDTTEWVAEQHEARGLRAKQWVRDAAGDLWLRKAPRPSRQSEPAIEVLALRLAALLGVEAAQGTLATWRDARGEHRGIVVRKFSERRSQFSQGAEVLRGCDGSYDPEVREAHTLSRVRGAIVALESRQDEVLWSPFARMMAFDALVGNADRHPGNWGVLRTAGVYKLAPMYDPAACLGAELQEGAGLLGPTTNGTSHGQLDRYIARCPSGFGDGRRLIRMSALVSDALKDDDFKKYAAAMVANLFVVRASFVETVRAVPDSWLSLARRRFILAALDARAMWLEGLVRRGSH